MKENPARKGRLLILIFVCAVFFITSLIAWIVNIELGLEAILRNPTVLKSLIPGFLFRAFTPYGADLSTVTTFVPVLVFLYPILHGVKIIGTETNDPTKLRHLDPDPYPSQFVLFLVLLGLAGTLYGMLVGLQVSGIGTIEEAGATGAGVVLSIKNLLAGISTAILSSLAGLVGAFIAASPLTRIFYWAACVEEEEQEIDLVEALKNLANNIGAVSKAGATTSGSPSVETMPATAQGQGAASLSPQNDAVLNQLTALVQVLREGNNEAKHDRDAIKKALALYVSERI